MPFKKGQVANPHGRPKRGKCFADIARQVLGAKEIKYTITMPPTEKNPTGVVNVHLKSTETFRHAIAVSLLREAMRGDTIAARELIDRTDGKVTDRTELSGPDGRPLAAEPTRIIIEHVKGKD